MKTIKTENINENYNIAHHLPDYSTQPTITNGMTLRAVLTELRLVDYGNIGGTFDIDLSDGSRIAVENKPSWCCGELMSSQRIVRRENDRGNDYIVRTYAI